MRDTFPNMNDKFPSTKTLIVIWAGIITFLAIIARG